MPPFDTDETRLELLKRLNGIPGVELPEGRDLKEAQQTFVPPGSLQKLYDVTEWFLAEATKD